MQAAENELLPLIIVNLVGLSATLILKIEHESAKRAEPGLTTYTLHQNVHTSKVG